LTPNEGSRGPARSSNKGALLPVHSPCSYRSLSMPSHEKPRDLTTTTKKEKRGEDALNRGEGEREKKRSFAAEHEKKESCHNSGRELRTNGQEEPLPSPVKQKQKKKKKKKKKKKERHSRVEPMKGRTTIKEQRKREKVPRWKEKGKERKRPLAEEKTRGLFGPPVPAKKEEIT